MNRGVVGLVIGLVLSGGVVSPLGAQEGARRVTLEEALTLARRNNPTLEQAQSAVQIAEYNRLTAWGQFLPDLNLSYQYNNSSTGRLDPTGQQIATTSYSAQLGGSLDIFQGFSPVCGFEGCESRGRPSGGAVPAVGVRDAGSGEDIVLQRGGDA